MSISLAACPPVKSMTCVLKDYYKKFGFIPEDKRSGRILTLYLDTKGTILKKYELESW